ncbi:MAG: protein kinase [Pirellulaceae bacterium]|nr:protein kinase [Pirellulaceae bacterium]
MTDAFALVRNHFMAALEKQGLEAQLRYVAEQCGETPELLAKLEEMIRAHHETEGFLASEPDVATTQLDASEKVGRRIGPYKLLQQIGEGGMGVVYMAEQLEPVERRVALKIIKPGMDSRQVIARFEAERQALAMMEHPNIARVIDAGATDSGRPFFAMELVNGLPITEFCDQHQLNARQRLELFIPVCQAVQHAHQKGIIHRDLKPSNILIAMYDDRPVPKVIDFGVAKAVGQRLTDKTMFTALGQIVGTIDYMSPEQVQLNQLDIDTRSDIYSLGVVLYELLAGEKPFDCQRLHAAAFEELLKIIREEEPPRPSIKLGSSQSLPAIAANRRIEPQKLSALVRGELDWIVMKALEKDRARRYETANGFAEDVRRYLDNESVLACPPSRMYRARKFVYRNKFLLIASALVFLALIAGIAGTGWQAYRATQAERLSLEKEQEAIHSAQEAIAAADQAKRSLMKAHEAVDRLLTRIGEDRLTNVPHSEQIRRGILEDALEIYNGLLSENRDDMELMRETAKASTRVAEIYDWLEEYGKAKLHKQEAIRAYEQLIELGDHSPELRFRLAQTLAKINNQSIQVRGLEFVNELLEEDDRNPDYLALRFNLEHRLADRLNVQGNYAEAMNRYATAIQFADTLNIDWPGETVIPLCNMLERYAIGLEAHPSKTLKYYQAAQRNLEASLKTQPENRKMRAALASILTQLSENYRYLGMIEKDKQIGAMSVKICESLCREFPDVRSYQRLHSHALATQAWSLSSSDPQRGDLFKRAYDIVESILRDNPRDLGAIVLSSRLASFLGEFYWSDGQYEPAKALFIRSLERRDEVMQIAPNSLDAIAGSSYSNFRLGNVYEQLGQHQQAIDFYRDEAAFRAEVFSRGSVDAAFFNQGLICLNAAARLLEQQGRFAESAQSLVETFNYYKKRKEYLAIDLNVAMEFWTYFKLMDLYHLAGDKEEVERWLTRACQTLQREIDHFKVGIQNGDPTLSKLRQALETFVDDPSVQEKLNRIEVSQDVLRTWLELRLDLTQALLKSYEASLSLAPQEPELLERREWLAQALVLDRAELLMLQGEIERATELCLEQLAVDDLDDKRRVKIYGRLAANSELFEAVVSLLPEPFELWKFKSEWCVRRAQWAQAAMACEKIADPELLAFCQLLSGDRQAFEATCQHEASVLRRLDNPSIGKLRITVLITSLSPSADHDRQEVLDWAKRCVELERNKFTLRALGEAHYRLGEFQQALAVFSEIDDEPDAVQNAYAFQRALAYRAVGEVTEGRRWYDFGTSQFAAARVVDGPVTWAIHHWASVNAWKQEADQVFAETQATTPSDHVRDEGDALP